MNKFRFHLKSVFVSTLECSPECMLIAQHIYFIYFLLSSNHFTHSFFSLCASFCVLPRRTLLFFFLAYSCQSHQFRCRNSLCVNRNHLCDGIEHCTDGTDELAENCDKNNVIIGKLHSPFFTQAYCL